jgi:putative glutamine amidotransferase
MLIPALGDAFDPRDLVRRLDGLLVTGSPSNVAVDLYGGAPDRPDSPQDPKRDATTLPLIRAAVEDGLPLFCICRGIQELNVAFGGTLHTRVHEQPAAFDHRAPQGEMEERYGPRHPVELAADSEIARLVGSRRIEVNSLHWQAIDRLGERLAVEGRAPDGVIEAVRVADARSFALGVQWHPEWKVLQNPVSVALFRAFGDAARRRAEQRAARGLAA